MILACNTANWDVCSDAATCTECKSGFHLKDAATCEGNHDENILRRMPMGCRAMAYY